MKTKRVENIIISGNKLDIQRLHILQQKPLPFTPGEPLFWNDPYISHQMLAAHLDPNIEAASRRPETIDHSVTWIVQELDLQPGEAILGPGCGPGLYASRLAEMGFRVPGVDFSPRSIDFANRYARDHNLKIVYRCQDYPKIEDESLYEVALLIYGDLCPLSPGLRQKLLANIRCALKPHGALVLDVSRYDPRNPDRSDTRWYSSMGGFWRPGPHLVLEQTFIYPEDTVHLDQYTVIEASGALAVYRIWRQEYTFESIKSELESGGFDVQSLWGDLTGMSCTEKTEWIGIVARKT